MDKNGLNPDEQNSILSDIINDIRHLDPAHCTGCGACFNTCPVDAITMEEDNEGFLTPIISQGKCVHCGKCATVCPALGFEFNNTNEPECYAVWAKDEVRYVSSSGGMFTLLADYVLEQGGIVCGAAFSNDFRSVSHIIIDHYSQLNQLRKSKYVQSDTNTVLKQIKQHLDNKNTPILFCGCPCQVAGLYKFLDKDYDNLITSDLICHGVPSPKVYKKHLEELSLDKTIKNVDFRPKNRGWGVWFDVDWNSGMPHTEDEHGIMYTIFWGGYGCRNCCYNCKYAKIQRTGDITIGDFWGVGTINPEWVDGKGTSLVLVNNIKSKLIIETLKSRMSLCTMAQLKDVMNVAKTRNGNLLWPMKISSLRNIFFSHLDKFGVKGALHYAKRERFDVGIVGWWNGVNFGSTLTSYALFRTILKLGFSPIFITAPVNKKNNPPVPTMTEFSRKHFAASKQRYPYEMHTLNEPCDMFLVGSDQLWNYDVFIKNGFLFLLDFVDNRHKKISYATSFAHSDNRFPDLQMPKSQYLMQRFDYVSVREDDGVKICANDFGVNATHVLDPVFIADKGEYFKLADDAKIKSEPGFIFAYILDPNEKKVESLQQIAEKLGKRIITFSDPQRLSNFNPDLLKDCGYIEDATIEDWVYHIIHCDFAFVDSFHGVCFAIIFEKNFISIANPFRGISRFTSLGKQLGIEDRIFYDASESCKNDNMFQPVDYRRVNAILATEKEHSLAWLTNALKSKKVATRNVYYPLVFNGNNVNWICDDDGVWRVITADGHTILATDGKTDKRWVKLPLSITLQPNKNYVFEVKAKWNTVVPLVRFLICSDNWQYQTILSSNAPKNVIHVLTTNFKSNLSATHFFLSSTDFLGDSNYIDIDYIRVSLIDDDAL